MNTPTKDINLALLIDVDNIAYRYTENILSELSKYGKVTIRRMYGDWSQCFKIQPHPHYAAEQFPR